MDPSRTSLELLSYFDGLAAADEPPAAARAARVRGVWWVLQWSAAVVVLGYSTSVLAEFAYRLGAERALARAARAGVLEATLPRATVGSVERSVWRRMEGRVGTRRDVRLALLQNGAPAGKRLALRDGDRVTLSLTVPVRAMMPEWLRTLTCWREDSVVWASAERVMPGRQAVRQAR